MSNYQENENNIKSEKEFSEWRLDESKLSETDKQVLELVNFPKHIKAQKCAGKRIAKFESNDTYHYKNNLTLDDIKYLVFTKKIAWYQIKAITPTGMTPQQVSASQEYIDKCQRTKPYKQVYIDGHYMQQELDWLLSNFSVPKPTPSMAKVEKVEETPTPTEKKVGKQKATLSDRDKAKAGQLYAAGQSAADIAKDLGKPKVTVVTYLKTLPKV